ncbi:MAG: hypothetical protein N2423_03840 [Novosphingobium sp.]|nr:hypothetical protein [Novosphingobium sp.]
MGLFKPDFYRFFVIGFAIGAFLVAATMDGSGAGQLRAGVLPVADAAPAE